LWIILLRQLWGDGLYYSLTQDIYDGIYWYLYLCFRCWMTAHTILSDPRRWPKPDSQLSHVLCRVDQIVLWLDINCLYHGITELQRSIPIIYHSLTFKQYWLPFVTIVTMPLHDTTQQNCESCFNQQKCFPISIRKFIK